MTARAIVLLERDDNHEVSRWVLAAAIVLAAHLGLVATYLLFFAQSQQGAPDAPAVMIDMAPMPMSPLSPADVAPGPEMVEVQPPPEPQVIEPPPPEPIVEPPPPEPVVPLVALPEPPPPQPPQVKEEPTPEKPPERKKVERKKPAPRTTAAPRSERNTADTAASPLSGANAAAAQASWRDQVVAQLQRAKRYPGGAESRREQGVVTLSFTLSRNGGVLGRSVARSSGNSELDQEVLAMVMRAQPFPSFPAGMPQASVHLTVPVRFSLR